MKKHVRADVMKSEIWSISNYRALITSKYFIALCLIISSFIVVLVGKIPSSLYILLPLFILPLILSFALKDYARRYDYKFLKLLTLERPFVLNNLKHKYHYSRVNYTAESISYFLILILICLWQFNYASTSGMKPAIIYLPSWIIISGVLVRLIVIIFYLIKLPYDLSHNKV